MISERMDAALNKQFGAELYSWYLYLAMAAHFEAQNFMGFAKWLKVQAQEELEHAMKFYDYITRVNGKLILGQIPAPPEQPGSHLDVFEHIYEHEVQITNSINDLVNLALEEKDHATNFFLQWFVNEQVEEVTTALTILERLRFIGDNHTGIFMLDRELGMRA